MLVEGVPWFAWVALAGSYDRPAGQGEIPTVNASRGMEELQGWAGFT